jgi:hypothetical protein
MKYLLTAALLWAFMAQDARKSKGPSDAQLNRFVFLAVLEGLYEDSMPDEIVKEILSQNDKQEFLNFVKNCPICTPTLEAFRAYRLRAQFYYERKGEPYSDPRPAEVDALLEENSKNAKAHRYNTALDRLMKRYMSHRLDRLRLSDDERSSWKAALAKGQDKMSDYDHCPWCAGAADFK